MSNTLTIEVRPKVLIAPVVDAGPDIHIQLPTDSANVTMVASDVDGVIVSYLWEVIAGGNSGMIVTNPNSASTLVKHLTAGSVTLRATVTDDDGQTATDEVIIETNAATNLDPIASIHGPYRINIGVNYENRIQLTDEYARTSDDIIPTLPADQYLFYIAGSVSDDTVFGKDASYFDLYDAGYTELRVLQSGLPPKIGTIISWDTATNKLIIEVVGGLEETEGNPLVDTPTLLYAKRIALDMDSSGSYDPDGSIASRLWGFSASQGLAVIDSPADVETKISGLVHTGIHHVDLVVIDNVGRTNVTGTAVTVDDQPSQSTDRQSATVDAGVKKGVTVTATAGGSAVLSATSTAPTTTTSSAYEWSVVSSPVGATPPTIEDPSTATPSINFEAGAQDGIYTMLVNFVTDEGYKASDTMEIEVSSTGVYLETVSEVILVGLKTVNLAIRGGQAGESVDLHFSMTSEEFYGITNYVDALDLDAQETRLQSPGMSTVTKTVILDGSGEFLFINEISVTPVALVGQTHTLTVTTTISQATSIITTPSSLTHSHTV